MTYCMKSILFLSVAALSLNACSSTKGPGAIGTKDDIAVINKGLGGAKMPQPFLDNEKAQGEDFTTTTEQAEAVAAPEVATPEVLEEQTPASSPAVATKMVEAPVTEQTQPVDVQQPIEQPQPAVQDQPVVQPQEQQQNVYPLEDYPVAATPVQQPLPEQNMTAAAPAPVAPPKEESPQPQIQTPVPAKNIPYPLDKNAAYSPKAMAAAAAAAGTPVTTPVLLPSGINLNDPAIVRSVQAKLAAQSLYVGPQTGMMDASLLNAIVQYQSKNKLTIGQLNEETLKHMGIIE